MSRLRAHLTYANVMATIAVFIALGGGAYAAVRISGSQIRDRSIPGRKVKDNALSGREIQERKLGTVPSATHASTADTATTASTATDATNLGGKPASDYRIACSSALQAADDVCFERARFAANTWEGALRVCARRKQRLPTPAELALVYEHTGALQDAAWTDVAYAYTPAGTRAFTLGQTSARVLQTGDTPRSLSLTYYCVRSPTNAP